MQAREGGGDVEGLRLERLGHPVAAHGGHVRRGATDLPGLLDLALVGVESDHLAATWARRRTRSCASRASVAAYGSSGRTFRLADSSPVAALSVFHVGVRQWSRCGAILPGRSRGAVSD
jgi:hypothetical protein